MTGETTPDSPSWPAALYRLLKELGIKQASWVPDAGHARLIELIEADNDVESVALTSEQEGIALAASAWLGGQRSVLLMQSSGVGNCINMLSLMESCRFPLLTIVTMRGEWAEFNPWQIPMSRATAPTLEAMGVRVMRVEQEADVIETVAAAATLAFEAEERVAVLLSQRLLGAKKW